MPVGSDEPERRMAPQKPDAACRVGEACAGCAGDCGPECECDCHWLDTNVLLADVSDRGVTR